MRGQQKATGWLVDCRVDWQWEWECCGGNAGVGDIVYALVLFEGGDDDVITRQLAARVLYQEGSEGFRSGSAEAGFRRSCQGALRVLFEGRGDKCNHQASCCACTAGGLSRSAAGHTKDSESGQDAALFAQRADARTQTTA